MSHVIARARLRFVSAVTMPRRYSVFDHRLALTGVELSEPMKRGRVKAFVREEQLLRRSDIETGRACCQLITDVQSDEHHPRAFSGENFPAPATASVAGSQSLPDTRSRSRATHRPIAHFLPPMNLAQTCSSGDVAAAAFGAANQSRACPISMPAPGKFSGWR